MRRSGLRSAPFGFTATLFGWLLFAYLCVFRCLTLEGVMRYNLWEILWLFIGFCHKMLKYHPFGCSKWSKNSTEREQWTKKVLKWYF